MKVSKVTQESRYGSTSSISSCSPQSNTSSSSGYYSTGHATGGEGDEATKNDGLRSDYYNQYRPIERPPKNNLNNYKKSQYVQSDSPTLTIINPPTTNVNENCLKTKPANKNAGANSLNCIKKMVFKFFFCLLLYLYVFIFDIIFYNFVGFLFLVCVKFYYCFLFIDLKSWKS
jgi:hypothetical protein